MPAAVSASAAARCPRRRARCGSSSGPHEHAVHRRRARRLFCARGYVVTTQSNRMGYRLDGPALSHGRARRHPVRRHAARVDAGARVGPADPADGRSTDDRRLSEDRDGDQLPICRSRASSRPATGSSSRRARDADALEALQRLERRLAGQAAMTDASSTGAARTAFGDARRSAMRRSRRSRPSRSAARPTGSSTVRRPERAAATRCEIARGARACRSPCSAAARTS